jgi:predicted DNA-binding transcriptional regulator YafY
LSKIEATLPSGYIDYLDRVRNRVDAGPAPRKDYTPFGAIIADLNRAIIEEKKIRMAYFSMSRRKESRRTVHPYRLRHMEDTLYLIGYCSLRKGVRTFAVDRIQSVSVTDEGFHIPAEFDVQAFMQDSFGIYEGPPVTVKIRFLKSVAGYVRERIWHRSQHLSEQADGSVIFTATVAGIEEISHWVLRWGAGAQVLAPDDLCRAISRHATAMAAHYQGGTGDINRRKPASGRPHGRSDE